MTTRTDNEPLDTPDIRDALAAIRQARPAPGAASRAVLAVEQARPSRPSPTLARVTLAIAATTAIGLGVFWALPAADDGSGRGLASLHAAAATAAEQPAPVTGYRYTKTLDRFTYRGTVGGLGPSRYDVTSEKWIGRNWKGRVVSAQPQNITGDWAAKSLRTGEHAWVYGDGMFKDLPFERLPTDGPDIDRFLRDIYRSGPWAPGFPTPAQETHDIVRVELLLLGDANTSPEQRAGLFEALAATPGVSDQGPGTDPLGRTGRVVDMRLSPGPVIGEGTVDVRLVFDPETSQLLSWSSTGLATKTTELPGQRHIYLASGYVADDHTRP